MCNCFIQRKGSLPEYTDDTYVVELSNTLDSQRRTNRYIIVGLSKILDSQRDKKAKGDKNTRGRIGMELDLRR